MDTFLCYDIAQDMDQSDDANDLKTCVTTSGPIWHSEIFYGSLSIC